MAQSPVHLKETHTQTSSGMFLYHRYFIVYHERMPQDDYDNDDYDNDDKGNEDENSATLKAKNVIQLGWASSSKPCPPFPQGIVLARISPSCYTYSNESGLIFLVSIRNIGSDQDCGLYSGIYIETLGGNYSEFLRLYRDILHDVTK